MMTNKTALVATVFVLGIIEATAAVSQQQPPKMIGSLSTSTLSGDVGIRPLTEATLAEAVTLGTDKGIEGVVQISSPAIIFLRLHTMLDFGRSAPLMDQYTKWTSMPYVVDFRTPFVSAAAAAAEAQRKFQPQPTLRLADLNTAGVVVSVSPGGDFSSAESIENVVFRRGTQVIKPTAAKVSPKTIRNRLGASRDLTEGNFTFDFSTFEPTAPVTMVLVGPTSNIEVEIGPQVLRVIR